MKLNTVLFVLAITSIADARLHSPGHRGLKQSKGSQQTTDLNRAGAGATLPKGGSKQKKAGGSGGNTASQRVADAYLKHLESIGQSPPSGSIVPVPVDNVNRADPDDDSCCNGPAQPQPADQFDDIGNRVGGCDLADGESFRPTYYASKKANKEFKLNSYITDVPRVHECECNDQCDVQDGTSMICCMQSHYFISVDNKPIKLCVDLTGITEAAESGCLVNPTSSALAGDPLDIANALPLEPNK